MEKRFKIIDLKEELSLRSSENGGILLKCFSIGAPRLAGRTLFFFSDTHFRCNPLQNFRGRGTLERWEGVSAIGDELKKAVLKVQPDWIVFGGDLCTHTVLFPEAFRLLSELKAPWKVAVPGNWDLRRSWIPFSFLEKQFRSAGFRLLRNASAAADGIFFYGADDFKAGYPVRKRRAKIPKNLFPVLLAHTPDSIFNCGMKGFPLGLCGHTHGGQLRLPFYGAVATSSVHGKRYEYGPYSMDGGTLIVSAGIGGTFLPIRFRCPPEVTVIRFV